MEKIFKAYSKGYKSLDSDSIFSFLGRKEVGMTKSIAALLYHDDEFLEFFFKLIKVKIKDVKDSISIFAEQQSDDKVHEKGRRDITIKVPVKSNKYILIVVEAKSPLINNKNTISIIEQLNEYFDPNVFTDTIDAKKKIGVTLTNERIVISTQNLHFNHFISLTWEDLVVNLEKIEFKNSITNSFLSELKKVNFMKTYDEEVFSPPATDSYNKIQKLNIYCCPYDRPLRNAIYLMPRISVNENKQLLTPYAITNLKQYKGRGFCLEIYKIESSFITDSKSLDAIEDDEIKNKVKSWLGPSNEALKVYVLGSRMKFLNPKFTAGKHMSYQAYYALSEIWQDTIPRKIEK